MRAARLLQILLLLQNRGRMTSGALAGELEVTRRTILRDVDALTEAGLPVLAHPGAQGGIELGFNYRTRLTGLALDEAEAMAVILTWPLPALEALGLGEAGARARRKVLESLPDAPRERIAAARSRYRRTPDTEEEGADLRIAAIAGAVRKGLAVRLNGGSAGSLTVRPSALELGREGWSLIVEGSGLQIPLADWGDIAVVAAAD